MKILYIITQGENGGGQKHVLDLAREMKSKNYNIHVSTGYQDTQKDNWLFSELEKIGIQKSNLNIFQNLVREISPIQEIKAFFEIYSYIKKEKFDVVHLHSVKAGTIGSIAARIAGAKVIYTVHGFTFLEPLSFPKKTFYIFAELFASFFRDFTILISKKDLQAGLKFFILRDVKLNNLEYKDRFALIYNGLDKSVKNKILDKSEARKFFFEKIGKVDEGQNLIGTISNLYKTKGLEYFIGAMDILVNKESKKDLLAVIIGEGNERENLERLIKEKKLENNFYLLGMIPEGYIYLSGLDTFVLSSVKEGLPYCLLEAILAGVPIVATRVGGIPEINEYIPMNLVESADSGDLSNKINFAINNKDLLSQAIKFSDVFSLDQMVEKVDLIYKNL